MEAGDRIGLGLRLVRREPEECCVALSLPLPLLFLLLSFFLQVLHFRYFRPILQGICRYLFCRQVLVPYSVRDLQVVSPDKTGRRSTPSSEVHKYYVFKGYLILIICN